ncbi:MAG: VacJ family lipoprotein [Desulfovibrionaceae bacterium]
MRAIKQCRSASVLFGCLLLCGLLLNGCATARHAPELSLKDSGFRVPHPRLAGLELIPGGFGEYIQVDDPAEGFNRRMYNFNAQFDRYVFLPVVQGYETAVPGLLRRGVSSAVDNINELPTLANSLLQGNLRKSGITLLRFVMNTVMGFGGLLDPAKGAGLVRQEEDFGQTLAVWGVPEGAYLVLPVLGPSSLRDAAGTGGDMIMAYYQMEALYDLASIEDRDTARNVNSGVRALDKRSRMPFRYFSTDSPFEYDFIRFLYMEKRRIDAEK